MCFKQINYHTYRTNKNQMSNSTYPQVPQQVTMPKEVSNTQCQFPFICLKPHLPTRIAAAIYCTAGYNGFDKKELSEGTGREGQIIWREFAIVKST